MASTIRPIIQRTTGIARGTLRQSERLGRRLVSDSFGTVQRLRHLRPTPKQGMDDVTLTRKVETEIFRPADAPKGSVDVNVVDGTVYLRGEVKRPEQITDLERRTQKIPEVRAVENLLHLRKTAAPIRADTPRSAQRTGTPRASKSSKPSTSRAPAGRGRPGKPSAAGAASRRRPAAANRRSSGEPSPTTLPPSPTPPPSPTVPTPTVPGPRTARSPKAKPTPQEGPAEGSGRAPLGSGSENRES
jgi:BON domain